MISREEGTGQDASEGETPEDRSALSTAVVHDRGSTAVMQGLIRRKLMPVWAGKPFRMERPFQILVTYPLTETFVDGKPDYRKG